MTQRTLKIFLEDILRSIEKIERYTSGMTQHDFEQNEMAVDAVLRNLEIIGEASGNIPDYFRDNYPDIPWKRVVGLRNIVIHAYFNVDLDIIWQIITINLPELKMNMKPILDHFENDEK
ncbi:MAG: DUF86 domain-containing protein [Desulfobacteraceae bacterium]|nr:DUF86 domain-containing protein [Desulfobacteraceae bacterium]